MFVAPEPVMEFVQANQSLKIYLPLVRCGEVRLIIDSLEVLDEVYRGFVCWNKLVSQAQQAALDEEGVHYRGAPRRELPEDCQIAAEESLCLAQVEVEVTTPAYVEIVGLSGPLQSLETYLSNERIDWQRERQEPDEQRRLMLEQQRIDTVRDQVELLRGLNYPEIQIREALSEYIFATLDRLDQFHGLKLHTEEPAPEQDTDSAAATRG
jgi:hypothetical protein